MSIVLLQHLLTSAVIGADGDERAEGVARLAGVIIRRAPMANSVATLASIARDIWAQSAKLLPDATDDERFDTILEARQRAEEILTARYENGDSERIVLDHSLDLIVNEIRTMKGKSGVTPSGEPQRPNIAALPPRREPPTSLNATKAYMRGAAIDTSTAFPSANLQLDAGLFQTQQRDGDAYAAMQYTPLNRSWKWFSVATDFTGGLALHEDLVTKGRPDLLASGAAQFFMGSRQSLASWCTLQEGFEFAPSIIGGVPVSPDVWLPATSGLSLRFNARKVAISVGETIDTPVVMANVQDAGSIRPDFEKATTHVTLHSYLNASLALDVYRDEGIDGHLQLSRLFRIPGSGRFSHEVEIAASVDSPLAGHEPFINRGISIWLAYHFGDPESGLRMRASADINPAAYTTESDEVTTHPVDYSLNSFDALSGVYWDTRALYALEGQTLKREVGGYDIPEGSEAWFAFEEEDEDKTFRNIFDRCRFLDGDSWICEGTASWTNEGISTDPFVAIDYQGIVRRIDGEFQLEDITSRARDYLLPLHAALAQEETIEGFATALDGATYDQKIRYLSQIRWTAEDTYKLVSTILPSGKTNVIGEQAIYNALRNNGIADHLEPTTVCRGFAAFITKLAKRWGLEAHSATITTDSSGHVISLVRKPGSDQYHYINYGDDLIASPHGSMLEALEAFSRHHGYVPLGYTIYDADGNFVRRLESAHGAALRERVTPRSRLNQFLFGKKETP